MNKELYLNMKVTSYCYRQSCWLRRLQDTAASGSCNLCPPWDRDPSWGNITDMLPWTQMRWESSCCQNSLSFQMSIQSSHLSQKQTALVEGSEKGESCRYDEGIYLSITKENWFILWRTRNWSYYDLLDLLSMTFMNLTYFRWPWPIYSQWHFPDLHWSTHISAHTTIWMSLPGWAHSAKLAFWSVPVARRCCKLHTSSMQQDDQGHWLWPRRNEIDW